MSIKVLEVLRSGKSYPTPVLVALCAGGLSFPRSRVWSVLRIMEKSNLVRKVGKRKSTTLWKLS